MKKTKTLEELEEVFKDKATVESIKKALIKSAAEMKERERKERLPPEVETGVCIACNGIVTGEYKNQALVPKSEIILGPGSRNQFGWVFKGYHCKRCGLKYEFPPPEEVHNVRGH